MVKYRLKKSAKKMLASTSLTIIFSILLLFSSTVQALNFNLGQFTNENPIKGEVISTIATIEVNANEIISGLQLDLLINNQICTFYQNGTIISPCSGVTINPISIPSSSTGYGYNYGYSYGYGYGYGISNSILSYNISINTTYFNEGSYNVTLSSDYGHSTQIEFTVKPIFSIPIGENQESATNITLQAEYRQDFSNNTVIIPNGTVITSTNNQPINLSQLTQSVINITSLRGEQGRIQFGIPNFGLLFSSPISIDIYVGPGLENRTFTVYRSLDASSWESITTCTIQSEICSFTTTRASYFAVADAPRRSSGRTINEEGNITVITEDETTIVEETIPDTIEEEIIVITPEEETTTVNQPTTDPEFSAPPTGLLIGNVPTILGVLLSLVLISVVVVYGKKRRKSL